MQILEWLQCPTSNVKENIFDITYSEKGYDTCYRCIAFSMKDVYIDKNAEILLK